MNTKDLLTSILFCLLIWFAFLACVWPASEDYTDTGVGCIDDCVEVADNH